MRERIRHIALAALLAASLGPLAGCSTSKLAIGAIGPILDNTRTAALRSDDTRTFYAGIPSNLILLEGFIETDPKDEKLRLNAAMLYFSYAFTFDKPEDMGYASKLYLRGFEHGKVVLFKNKDIARAWDAPFSEFTASLERLDEDDIEGALWTVANWAQFVSLHLDSTAVLTQIPRALALLERTCEIDGAFFEGLPYMMLGALHAFRPPMLGGDPVASDEAFHKAFDVSDRKFLLAQYLYAKFYCYRMQDPDLFETTLQEVLDQPASISPEYVLLNMIAKDKARTLIEEKDDLF